MRFDVPDPAFTDSAQARAHLRLAGKLAAGFVALIWLVHLMHWALDLDAAPFGVRPRQLVGLVGIFVAPLAHGDFEHLIANTLPLLVLGTAMLFLYPVSSLRALPLIYLGPGVAVWLFGRDSIHVGASGLIYGLVAYIFVAGLLRRDRRAIGASLVVAFMYASLVVGVLPVQGGISWETHLAAALVGVLLAIALRRYDVPPRKRYSWEEEEKEEEETATEEASDPTAGPNSSGSDRH
ncbi:MAG TPA: rhomboid family intramembrane serine protease [Burkholderiaceae bacterium]|nr:rhomboid family intramembrane serine protease [Burkholderiaceae bacterium]